jgi:hypothetical protein
LGLLHGHKRHDVGDRAGQRQGHHLPGGDAVIAQSAGQPIGPAVELGIGKLAVCRAQRRGLGGAGRLRREQRRQAGGRHRSRRRCDALGQRPTGRVGGHALAAFHGPLRVVGEHRDKALQPIGERRGPGRGHRVGAVVQRQAQALPRAGDDRQGVVRGVVGLDLGDAHLADVVVEEVAGVVLKRQQGVEQLAQPDSPLNLGQAEVLAVQQLGLLVLQAAQRLAEGLGGAQADPHGHGVDQQPHHVLRPDELGGPSGHGRAEHDVVAAGGGRQDQRPAALQHRVKGQPVVPGGVDHRRGGLGRQLHRVRGAGTGGAVHGRGQVGGLRQARQRLVPRGSCRAVVLIEQPREVVAVGRHRRQHRLVASVGVEGEQLAHQQRCGPAIEQDVVARQDELVARLSVGPATEVGQHQPQRRGAGEIEAAGALSGGELDGPVGAVLGGVLAEVDLAPGQLDGAGDELGGLARAAGLKARPQVRVAAQQGLRGRPQRGGVEGPVEGQHQLYGVGVATLGAAGAVVEGVEQQPLLQRRQRQQVLQAGALHHSSSRPAGGRSRSAGGRSWSARGRTSSTAVLWGSPSRPTVEKPARAKAASEASLRSSGSATIRVQAGSAFSSPSAVARSSAVPSPRPQRCGSPMAMWTPRSWGRTW